MSPAAAAHPGRAQRRVITLGLVLGLFLAALDVLVVSPALPNVVADLGGLPLYPWVFSAYLLAVTVTAPIFGRLADAYGGRRLYLAGIGTFVLGSALCGAAPAMGFLVAMRALQGLGAGALISVTLTLAGELYPLEERARLQGLFASVWGIASVIGPPVGGTLVATLGWRSVFYLNVPFGLAAALLIARQLPAAAGEGRAHALDVPAALSLAGGLSAGLVALQDLGRGQQLGSPRVVGLAVTGLALLAFFAWRERASTEPLVDTTLLRHRIFLAANAGGFLGFAALYAATAFVPLLVRGVRGGSPQQAGLALMPLSLAWVATSILSGRLMMRTGYKTQTGAGMTLVALGCLGLARLDGAQASGWQLGGTLAVLGGGMGLAMTGFIVAVQGAAPPGRMGIASSSVQFFRSLGGGVGVALLGAVLLRGLRVQGIDAGGAALLGEGLAGTASHLPPEALRLALHGVFATALAFAVLGLPAGFAMPGGRPQRHLHAARRQPDGGGH